MCKWTSKYSPINTNQVRNEELHVMDRTSWKTKKSSQFSRGESFIDKFIIFYNVPTFVILWIKLGAHLNGEVKILWHIENRDWFQIRRSHLQLKIIYRRLKIATSPRIEKKIMKPADIWTTLRLPTRVSASNPAFSLKENWIVKITPLQQE